MEMLGAEEGKGTGCSGGWKGQAVQGGGGRAPVCARKISDFPRRLRPAAGDRGGMGLLYVGCKVEKRRVDRRRDGHVEDLRLYLLPRSVGEFGRRKGIGRGVASQQGRVEILPEVRCQHRLPHP